MTEFNEDKINRDASGKFASKVSGEPDGVDISSTPSETADQLVDRSRNDRDVTAADIERVYDAQFEALNAVPYEPASYTAGVKDLMERRELTYAQLGAEDNGMILTEDAQGRVRWTMDGLDEDQARRYYSATDDMGYPHREGAPAEVDESGVSFYTHGRLNRDPNEGPATYASDGTCSYWVDGRPVVPSDEQIRSAGVFKYGEQLYYMNPEDGEKPYETATLASFYDPTRVL